MLLQFARLYPLNQLDLPVEKKHVDFGPLMAPGAKIENPSRDYTPPSTFCSVSTPLVLSVFAHGPYFAAHKFVLLLLHTYVPSMCGQTPVQ